MGGANDEEEDDYMSMTIVEPPKPTKETYTQRRLRKQRESEAKSRVPSKAELAAAEAAKRDEALSSSTLDPSNPGFKMMAKLGFKPGNTLGKNHSSQASGSGEPGKNDAKSDARTDPINLIVKEGRGGIGLDSEKKRKFREEAEEESKRVKAEEGDFRERVRLEREEKRTENLVRAAQKVTERLDAEAENESKEQSNLGNVPTAEKRQRQQDPGKSASAKPISKVNILYRGLVRHREEKLREQRMRRGFIDSLSSQAPSLSSTTPEFDPGRLPRFTDSTLDRDDQIAIGEDSNQANQGQANKPALQEEELEEEDPELEEFNALEPAERLRRLVVYLRENFRYCFWCKFRYEGEDMEGCPGLTEEDHD
ncbi:hypothetical protein FQN54_003193 [Arachnomyces sp. PD_36]|nr:hypothetical protein FQN54_003193 [Arachnomyces sp. PD_36]